SAVGERNEALEAAREAVRLRRALAEASPAAYAPDLAMSLTNLAAFLSEVGKQDEALEAAREAVRLRRALAEASPQAYTPNLAMSLTNLANILSAVGERNEALETFVEGFDCFSPAVRARLLVARATWRDDGGEAGDVVAAAREADSTDDPVLLGPVRRMIARVITDAGIMGTGLPRWVTVDAESATSRIKGWLECSDLAQRVAFLEVQWSSPSASEKETLAALAELNVDRPSVAELAALVERIADSGIQAVTTDLRTHHRAQLLARDWYEAHLNGRGASFLREHMRGNPDASRGEGQISEGGKQEPEEREKDLGDPDMRIRVLQVLAATLPEDEVAIMDAIIELAQLADQSTAYDAQRSDEGAEDTLREFLEARNWRAMILVLGLRPSVAESTYGRIARLLSEAVTDEPVQRLRELYEHANEEMDAIHRRQLQALLDKALRTDQCTPAFADILSWTRNSGSRQQ
uniref:tetratricopeptide repeat protein n=1 Tax=Schaalia odontolytica TaxID=1660 RepID=UPI0028526DD7